MSLRRKCFVLYVLLLVASFVWQQQTKTRPDVPVGMESVDLTDAFVRYARFGEPHGTKHIVMVHGSPMAGQSLHRAGAELAERLEGVTVWVPDLPGFGASRQELKDYSFLAHSFYLEEFLDRMNIPPAHFLAYSQGGGVVLSLLERSPGKALSISLVSAIGVQELELLGRYGANHAIHGIQLLLFRGLENLLPHFGLFDGFLLNSRYARNFYDSDQRPLRQILKTIELPTQIIHGQDDSLVPYAVALEHYRLVPQSELLSLSGGHGLVMQAPENLIVALAKFMQSVETGAAKSKQFAAPERVLAADQPFDRAELPPPGGIAVLIVGLGVILFSYVTEDLAAIAAGIMAAAGTFSLFQAIVFTFLGIYSGDMLVFLSGRWLRRTRGEAAFKHPRLQRGEQWFKKRSTSAIVLARFVPGSRFAVFFAAGALGVSFRLFSVLLVVPALIWTPALVGLAYLAGEQTLRFFRNYSQFALPVAIGLALAFWMLMQLITLSVNRKARRRAYGRFKRLRHWEFWPRWAFYPPVFLYVCYLGLRFRSLSLFTLANPAIEAGGFVGESKSQILAGLSPADVPVWTLLDVVDPERAITLAEQFMQGHALGYPVVLKPDQGERGSGVEIVKSAAELQSYLRTARLPTIIQKFQPGIEYGVFYYRMPNEAKGRIFAITDKARVVLRGNGEDTLETLILNDERAVCMLDCHLHKHRNSLLRIPADKEDIELVEVGTHSRGCVFLDGMHRWTPALEASIEKISRHYEGFYFGRYDIMVDSAAALADGRDLKVLELNGVTSEATSIYDPKNSVFTAWGVLFRQWRLAFEIGAQNRRAGLKPYGILPLLKLLRAAP